MSVEIQRIHPGNLQDVVEVVNRSSSGHVFQYNLDVFGFMALSRFWNLSYEHSFLCYVANRPAGVMLNAVDPAEREAFSLYWGVLPDFRGGRVAMSLMHAYFSLLQRQGYLRTSADTAHGSPSPIYEKLGARSRHVFAEVESEMLALPEDQGEYDVREPDSQQLLSILSSFPGPRHWAQGPNFYSNSVRSLSPLAAFKDGRVEGYLVRTFSSGCLSVLDFRFASESAGHMLLRSAFNPNVPPPYRVSFVTVPSREYDLLCDAGFSGDKLATFITLDFSSTASKFVRGTSR